MEADAGMSAAGRWVHGRPGSLLCLWRPGPARAGHEWPDGIAAAGSRVFSLPFC